MISGPLEDCKKEFDEPMLTDGRMLPAELVVWPAGVKAPDVLTDLGGLETNRLNQLVVRSTLQTTHDDDVFALGDCATCPWTSEVSSRTLSVAWRLGATSLASTAGGRQMGCQEAAGHHRQFMAAGCPRDDAAARRLTCA
jgi:NADH dehydrogenase FAD-containing subunit